MKIMTRRNPECKGRDDYRIGRVSIKGMVKDLLARQFETDYLGKHYAKLGYPYDRIGAAYTAFSNVLRLDIKNILATFGMVETKACYEHFEFRYFVPMDKKLAYGFLNDDKNNAYALAEAGHALHQMKKNDEGDNIETMANRERAALRWLENELDELPDNAWPEQRKVSAIDPFSIRAKRA